MEGKKPDNMDAGRYVCETALVVLYANEDKAVTIVQRSLHLVSERNSTCDNDTVSWTIAGK